MHKILTTRIKTESCNKFKCKELLFETELLRRMGAIAIEDCLSPEITAKLHLQVMRQLQETPPKDYGNINCTFHRADLKIPLNGLVSSVIKEVVGVISPILKNLLGDNPILAELGTIVALPGCIKQPIHPDSNFSSKPLTAELITVFVSLCDIDRAMGPLEIWPETHKADFDKDDSLTSWLSHESRGITMQVSGSTAIMMNSRTWHRGTDNFSTQARPLFYFSFLGDGVRPDGPTWTILPNISGRFRLSDFDNQKLI